MARATGKLPARAGAPTRPVEDKLVLPVERWPLPDQQCWRRGTDPIQRLHRARHADSLTPRSIDAARQSYGRLLALLAKRGLLDPGIDPAVRITFEVVSLYFDALRAAGNKDNTIKGRMFHLRTALHIMAPRADFDWITRPGDVPLDAILRQEVKVAMLVPSSMRLFKWGLSLMSEHALPEDPQQRLEACRSFRNGLIIALLACRAPRLGSLARMRQGKNLYRLNGEYWARLPGMIVKNRRELHYSLPASLTPYFDRYLTEIRPILLDPAATDVLWGNGDGTAYTYRSIQTMLFRQTAREFERSFGPHRFRHAFASTLAESDPANPGLAAVVLGISEGVLHEHYRKARQADAARKFQVNLSHERERTRVMADRALGTRAG